MNNKKDKWSNSKRSCRAFRNYFKPKPIIPGIIFNFPEGVRPCAIHAVVCRFMLACGM